MWLMWSPPLHISVVGYRDYERHRNILRIEMRVNGRVYLLLRTEVYWGLGSKYCSEFEAHTHVFLLVRNLNKNLWEKPNTFLKYLYVPILQFFPASFSSSSHVAHLARLGKKVGFRCGEFCFLYCLSLLSGLPAACTQPGVHLLAEPFRGLLRQAKGHGYSQEKACIRFTQP